MKTNQGYMLVVLLLVSAIIGILAVKMLGKPAESVPVNEEAAQKAEVDNAASYQGAIQTKTKASAMVNSENAYNQNLQNELDQ
jgi:L-cystine uptake protein TcyP (sodium:dicarboxylate symporter family)